MWVQATVNPRNVLPQECFAEDLKQTDGARYLNQFQRDKSLHQSHIGTSFHLWTIHLAVRSHVLAESVQSTETTLMIVKTDRTREGTSRGTTHWARAEFTITALLSFRASIHFGVADIISSRHVPRESPCSNFQTLWLHWTKKIGK